MRSFFEKIKRISLTSKVLIAVGVIVTMGIALAPPCSRIGDLGFSLGLKKEGIVLSKEAHSIIEKVIMSEITAKNPALKTIFSFGKFMPDISNIPGLNYGFQEIIMRGNKSYEKHLFQPVYVYDNGLDSLVMMGMFAGRDAVTNTAIPSEYTVRKMGVQLKDAVGKIPVWGRVTGNATSDNHIILISGPDCSECKKERAELMVLRKMVPDLVVDVVYYASSKNGMSKIEILLGVENSKRLIAEELLSMMDTSDKSKMLSMLKTADINYAALNKKELAERLDYGVQLAHKLGLRKAPAIAFIEKGLVMGGFVSAVRIHKAMNGTIGN